MRTSTAKHTLLPDLDRYPCDACYQSEELVPLSQLQRECEGLQIIFTDLN